MYYSFDFLVKKLKIQVPETRPKQSGLKIFSQKLGFKRSTSKDKFAQASVNPALFSPGGPNAVRKSNFRTIGVGKIDMDTAQKFEQFRPESKFKNNQLISKTRSMETSKFI